MLKIIKDYLNDIKVKSRTTDLIQLKESILYTLLFEKDIETSLRLFDDVSIEFKRKIEEKLTSIEKEKQLIEQWKIENI